MLYTERTDKDGGCLDTCRGGYVLCNKDHTPLSPHLTHTEFWPSNCIISETYYTVAWKWLDILSFYTKQTRSFSQKAWYCTSNMAMIVFSNFYLSNFSTFFWYSFIANSLLIIVIFMIHFNQKTDENFYFWDAKNYCLCFCWKRSRKIFLRIE